MSQGTGPALQKEKKNKEENGRDVERRSQVALAGPVWAWCCLFLSFLTLVLSWNCFCLGKRGLALLSCRAVWPRLGPLECRARPRRNKKKQPKFNAWRKVSRKRAGARKSKHASMEYMYIYGVLMIAMNRVGRGSDHSGGRHDGR